jgi:hypothetical protein
VGVRQVERRVSTYPKLLSRTPQQRHVANGLGDGDLQQSPALHREQFETPQEALLDAARKRQGPG